jgi:UDP-glucose 4-epimerase
MKVIVTGGCGFIGGHLVDRLVDLNHDVTVIDDLSANNDIFYYNKKAAYHKINIINYNEIEPLFENIDYVFHLAAEARIQPSIENPQHAVLTNVLGTTNVLKAGIKHKIKKIIYSSTSAVYGLTEELPTNENQKIDCLNPYSVTKYGGEEMIRCFNKLYGLDACIFRYFNVYGERSPVSGPYSLVVGIFLNQLKNKENLTVVGDGMNERDFIHVSDVIEANILAMNHTEELNAEVFNIGYGENYKIIDIAKIISNNIIHLPPRIGEAKSTLANVEKARRKLKWQPKVKIHEWLKNQIQNLI